MKLRSGEDGRLNTREVRRRLGQNDPTLRHLRITLFRDGDGGDCDCFLGSSGWRKILNFSQAGEITHEEDVIRVGKDIGSNTYLEHLDIRGNFHGGVVSDESRREMELLSQGIGCNQSIRSMFTSGENDCIHLLSSFLKNNDNLNRILLQMHTNTPDQLALLLDALAKRSNNTLQDFQLFWSSNKYGDEIGKSFYTVFQNQPDKIPKALDLLCVDLTESGLKYLINLLRIPNCSVTKLRFHVPYFDHEFARCLCDALKHNKSLSTLDVHYDSGDLPENFNLESDNLLCDRTSIGSIYASNHTLQSVKIDEYSYFNSSISRSFKINKSEDKTAVARRKILENDFVRNFKAESLFEEMQPALVLRVVNFMDKGASEDLGKIYMDPLDLTLARSELLYHFTRNNPLVCKRE